MNIFNSKIITLCLTFSISLPGSVFAIDLFKEKDAIWRKDRNEYIKIAQQDESSFGNNDHPVELNEEEIRTALEYLKIPEKNKAVSEEGQKSVFTDIQIELLSQNLAKGLAQATPNKDIIFALEKNDDKIFGVIKRRLFVAGRAFYKDKNLNIIIGDYDRPRDKGFEAAYDPTRVGIVKYHFDHGRRSTRSERFKKFTVKVQGIENKKLKDALRNDWLVIDLKLVSEASVLRAKMQKQEEMDRKREELKELLGSTQQQELNRVDSEQQALREKVEQLERELRATQKERDTAASTVGGAAAISGTAAAVSGSAPAESGSAPAVSGSAPAVSGSAAAESGPAAAVSGSAPAVSGSAAAESDSAAISQEPTMEDRLTILKHLWENGLITEEVYKARVDKVLDETL